MANNNIQKQNFEFDGTTMKIFGLTGFRSGKNWVVNSCGLLVEVDPSPVKAEIEALLQADIDAGDFNRIDHISLKPLYALSLFLEGALPLASMLEAEGMEGEVIFPEVPLDTSMGTKKFTIKVGEGVVMATIDENGLVV